MSGDAAQADPGTVEIVNADGAGSVLLLCEHASNHIPARYDGLGLDDAAARSHAAWDPGARDLSLLLSNALDAPLVASRVSRLVYDCNRPPEAASAMPEKSEVIEIPGNRDLSDAERARRVDEIYRPFCAAVSDLIDRRKRLGRPTALVTVHSFSPVWFGQPRAVEIGLLHDSDARMADIMLRAAGHLLGGRKVARNQPYGPEDGVTHSLKLHGLAQDLPNVMIEIRNDLLTTPEAVAGIAQELHGLLVPALSGLGLNRPGGDDA